MDEVYVSDTSSSALVFCYKEIYWKRLLLRFIAEHFSHLTLLTMQKLFFRFETKKRRPENNKFYQVKTLLPLLQLSPLRETCFRSAEI